MTVLKFTNKNSCKDHGRTFLGGLNPFLRLGQFGGVCPVKAILSRRSPFSFKLKTSKVLTIYSFVVFISYVAVNCYQFVSEEDPDDEESESVSIFKEIVNRYLFFILGCISIIVSFTQKNKVIEFLDLIRKIDGDLKQLSLELDYSETKKTFTIQNCVGGLVCAVVLLTSYFTTNISNSLEHFMLSVILFTMFGQFIGGLRLLRKRFNLINHEINNIEGEEGIKTFHGIITTPTIKLQVLGSTHDALCDAAELWNHVYMVQMLFFVALVFLVTLFAVFSNFRLVFGAHQRINSSVGLEILRNSTMAVFMSSLTVVILTASSSTCDEVRIFIINYSNY